MFGRTHSRQQQGGVGMNPAIESRTRERECGESPARLSITVAGLLLASCELASLLFLALGYLLFGFLPPKFSKFSFFKNYEARAFSLREFASFARTLLAAKLASFFLRVCCQVARKSSAPSRHLKYELCIRIASA